ncbi:MAG: hypothetical protein ACSHX5_12155 [Phycisphaerales bacterium]
MGHSHGAIAALVLLSTSAHAGINDDFESYTLGGNPGGIWEDASSYITNPTNPGPTNAVISTTDAFGNATQAVQIQDGIGTSGGLIANVGHSNIQRFETDLRLDQSGNGSSPNWIAAAGFFQETVQTDFNWMPQAVVYATRNSNRFRLFVQNADGRGGAARDFGLGAHTWSLDTWYRISIEVDTLTGVFETSIIDIETGEILSDVTRTYNGWSSEFGRYDLISVNDGEYGSNPGTIGNMATIDNVNHVPAPSSMITIGACGLIASRRRRS